MYIALYICAKQYIYMLITWPGTRSLNVLSINILSKEVPERERTERCSPEGKEKVNGKVKGKGKGNNSSRGCWQAHCLVTHGESAGGSQKEGVEGLCLDSRR